MTRRKSWIRGGLVVLFCLLFAATAFAGGSSEKPMATKGFVVGLSNGPFTHSWRVQMIESLHQQAEVYIARGWMSKLIVQNAGEDVNTQIAQIRNLIASKVNLILINPNSATALVPVIKEAQDAGILCIIYDQPVDNPPCLNIHMHQAWWMGPIVDWLAKQLNGKGNIVYISGIADQPGNIERDQAATDSAEEVPRHQAPRHGQRQLGPGGRAAEDDRHARLLPQHRRRPDPGRHVPGHPAGLRRGRAQDPARDG